MSKLSLDALKQRAEAVASEDLLATISGGTENACHPDDKKRHPHNEQYDESPRHPLSPLGQLIADWIYDKVNN